MVSVTAERDKVSIAQRNNAKVGKRLLESYGAMQELLPFFPTVEAAQMQAVNLFMYNIGVSRVQTRFFFKEHMLWLVNWCTISLLKWSARSLSTKIFAQTRDFSQLMISGIQVDHSLYALCIGTSKKFAWKRYAYNALSKQIEAEELQKPNKARNSCSFSYIEGTGTVYLIGGHSNDDNAKIFNSCDSYSVRQEKWMEAPPLNHARF